MERLVTLHIRYLRTIYTTKIFRIFLTDKKKKEKKKLNERTNEYLVRSAEGEHNAKGIILLYW